MAMLAVVAGKPYTDAPHDLFIPPDALEVLLDSFTGPLDLLLYLIRRQNIDILDIPILTITQQYMQYIDLMEERRMELAADYLVMAAVLAEIKSRLLLPVKPTEQDNDGDDPRMELVRRLQIYEQFKQTALMMDMLDRRERDVFQVCVSPTDITEKKAVPEITLSALVDAMNSLLQHQTHLTHHQVSREPLSVRERMTMILQRLNDEGMIDFVSLFTVSEGRMGRVVSLLAMLELAKQTLVVVTQSAEYTPIYIRAN